MELREVPAQLSKTIARQWPLELYDQGKLVGIVVPPEIYEENHKGAARRLIALMDEIGRKMPPISREEMKELLEIDDEEYDNLGLGQ